MRKIALAVLGLVVLVVGGRFIYGMFSHPDDGTLIKQSLSEAVQASKDGRAGSVIDLLAANFTVNGDRPESQQIVDIVKKSHPDVDIANTDPVITGDTAQITSDVSVKLDTLGISRTLSFKDAQFVFKKEAATEWFVIPTIKWRLSAIRVSAADVSGLSYP
ncbi:MAG TPA: hypothetical protein VMI31_17510 [Fimbriimonadaceae bacterium]|nr:hypothetical protein [Fimbriimonadaceae bacterium]